MTALDDEPVGFQLTDAGWSAARATMTTTEAAQLLGIGRDYVTTEAKYGRLRGVKVGGAWLLNRASVETWVAERTAAVSACRRLPAGPLLRHVALRGGPAACGAPRGSGLAKALERAELEGSLTARAADELAVRLLGLTPWEVWGPVYDAPELLLDRCEGGDGPPGNL